MTRWLARCKDEMARLNALPDTVNREQLLFGINQGAVYEDIRIELGRGFALGPDTVSRLDMVAGVTETALSLVGKISYVFGGKYNRLGWNDAWGNANEAEEGDKIKISRYDGLDCSGFVSWVFINALGDPSALRVIGNGSSNQWAHSQAIGWDEGKPGDLAFYCAPGQQQYNHVGVIVAVDNDGSYLIAHCSSLQDGVVVTDGWSTGFRYLRRPAFFQ